MNELAPSLPPPLSQPHWRRAFGGVWRLSFRQFIAPRSLLIVLGLLIAFALLSVASLDHNASRFSEWSVHFFLTFLVPVASFLSAAGASRDDVSTCTADYVLTRPVSRRLYVVFRYLSHLACVQVVLLVALAALMGAGVFRNIPNLGSAFMALLPAQVLCAAAFTALGFLCGILTGRYLVVGVIYGFIVEAAASNIPTQLSRLAMTHHVRVVQGELPDESALSSAGVLLAYSAVVLGVAALCFSLRELAGSRPKET